MHEMSRPYHIAAGLSVCVAKTRVVPFLPTPPPQLLSSAELVSPLQAGETSTRKVKSAWAVVRFNPPNCWRHAFFEAFLSSTGGGKNSRIMCIYLPVIRCISSLSFYLMIGFYSEGQYFWSVMNLLSGDLRVGGEKGDEKKETAVILRLWTTLNLYKI